MTEREAGKAALRQKVVLLIEDDPESLEELRDALAYSGFVPIGLNTGLDREKDAVRATRVIEPDAVLVDCRLKSCSGLDVARRLRRDPKSARIPVILMSKPFTQRKLVCAIQSALHKA